VVRGSSTTWVMRVNGSSSTTRTGCRSEAVIRRLPGTGSGSGRGGLEGNVEGLQDAGVHVVGADQDGQLDDLLLAEIASQGIEDSVGDLDVARHSIRIRQDRPLAIVEEGR